MRKQQSETPDDQTVPAPMGPFIPGPSRAPKTDDTTAAEPPAPPSEDEVTTDEH